MDNELKELIAKIKERMPALADDERLNVVGEIIAGYCVECGRKTHERCYCTNDE